MSLTHLLFVLGCPSCVSDQTQELLWQQGQLIQRGTSQHLEFSGFAPSTHTFPNYEETKEHRKDRMQNTVSFIASETEDYHKALFSFSTCNLQIHLDEYSTVPFLFWQAWQVCFSISVLHLCSKLLWNLSTNAYCTC